MVVLEENGVVRATQVLRPDDLAIDRADDDASVIAQCPRHLRVHEGSLKSCPNFAEMARPRLPPAKTHRVTPSVWRPGSEPSGSSNALSTIP